MAWTRHRRGAGETRARRGRCAGEARARRGRGAGEARVRRGRGASYIVVRVLRAPLPRGLGNCSELFKTVHPRTVFGTVQNSWKTLFMPA